MRFFCQTIQRIRTLAGRRHSKPSWHIQDPGWNIQLQLKFQTPCSRRYYLQVKYCDARVGRDALRQHCCLTVSKTAALQSELLHVFVLLDGGRNLPRVFIGFALRTITPVSWRTLFWKGHRLLAPADPQ
jgi:hypothetical protein